MLSDFHLPASPHIFEHKAIAIIAVRQAAISARDHLKGFYIKADNLLLEETELSEDGNYWSITLSYLPNECYSTVFNRRREYKIFTGNGLSAGKHGSAGSPGFGNHAQHFIGVQLAYNRALPNALFQRVAYF